jgi:hypothetical protein
MTYLRSNWSRGRLCTAAVPLLSKGLQTNTQDLILSDGLHVPKWMEQSPSWKSDRISASKRIPHAEWKWQVHWCFRKNPPLVRSLSQIYPVHALASCFFKLDFLILPSTPRSSNWSFLLHVFPPKLYVYFCFIPYVPHAQSISSSLFVWAWWVFLSH